MSRRELATGLRRRLAAVYRRSPACGPEVERALVGYGLTAFALTALGRAKLVAAAAEWRAERGDAPRAGCDCCECREVRA